MALCMSLAVAVYTVMLVGLPAVMENRHQNGNLGWCIRYVHHASLQLCRSTVSRVPAGPVSRVHVHWVCEFGGLEWWNGMVEWTTGVEYWTGLLECHAHK